MSEIHFPLDLSPSEAVRQQKKLREEIQIQPLEGSVETVAGADISFNRGSDVMHAGMVVLTFPDLKEVARSLVSARMDFPYIPGLLAFREIPSLLEAWELLKVKPDVVILDGHGIAHPRRMGIATHFGIVANQPTIGCAKKILTGTYEEPDSEKGSYSYIKHRGENIGIALRSRTNVNPIFVSPGHLVSFENTYSIVMQCLTGFKLPETTRIAHKMVNRLRKGDIDAGYSKQ